MDVGNTPKHLISRHVPHIQGRLCLIQAVSSLLRDRSFFFFFYTSPVPHGEEVLAHGVQQVPRVAALHILVQGDSLERAPPVEVLPEDGPCGPRVQVRGRCLSSSSAAASYASYPYSPYSQFCPAAAAIERSSGGRYTLRQPPADGRQVPGLALADAAGVDDDVGREVRQVRGVVNGRVRRSTGRGATRVGRGLLGGFAVGASGEAVETRLLGCLLAGGGGG